MTRRHTTSTFAAILILVTVSGCELGDELGDFEPSDELLDALEEADANAELPDAILAGGRPDFQSHISVGYMTAPNGYICSGQRISRTLFLTAAHCVNAVNKQRTPWNRVKVGFGKRSANFAVTATRAWANPKFNGRPGSPFDIGIVVMSRGVPYVPNASIGRIQVGQVVDMVGYGAPTFERRSGQALVSERVSNGHFGIQLNGAGVCSGDSGGGVMNPFKQNQILATNAYAEACGVGNQAGVMDLRRDGNRQPLQYVGAKFD